MTNEARGVELIFLLFDFECDDGVMVLVGGPELAFKPEARVYTKGQWMAVVLIF